MVVSFSKHWSKQFLRGREMCVAYSYIIVCTGFFMERDFFMEQEGLMPPLKFYFSLMLASLKGHTCTEYTSINS